MLSYCLTPTQIKLAKNKTSLSEERQKSVDSHSVYGFFVLNRYFVNKKYLNVLSGGKFGHGFAAAAAIVGGTASSLSGGKFVNGAITGAFSRLFNDEVAHHGNNPTLKAKYEKGLERVKKAVDDFGLLDIFEGKSNDGTTINFKIDNAN